MARSQLEAALPAGVDPRRYARVLERVYEAALAGDRTHAPPRTVIGDSWRRMRTKGVDPDRGGGDPVPLPVEDVEARRRASGLSDVLPVLRDGLVSVAEEAAHIMVVVDGDGRVLWRDGSSAVRRRADGLGFVEGASWHEESVGTNAIGTAIVARRPLQVYSAEHFVRSHHAWTCAAAPLRDPRDGRLLGVVDLSGPAATVHPTTLALVDAVARLAESRLRDAHLSGLERLRAVATPLLARIDGPAVVVDAHGWIAATAGVAPVDRVLLPEDMTAGSAWLPAYGRCGVEPVPGGWLLRPGVVADGAERTTVVLDVTAPRRPTLTVDGPAGTWTHALSPRHAELLYVLARSDGGRSAAQLAGDLFGDPSRTVTIRAEMSRLRRHLGGVLTHLPYRFADEVAVAVRAPEDGARLLPWSTSPVIMKDRGPHRGLDPS